MKPESAASKFVVLYARVSTARQAEMDLSIPDQLRQMRMWAQQSGYQVFREFKEPGASATDDKRPVFQEMLALATQKPAKFAAIIVYTLSRFYRDGIEFGVHERKLAKNKVKVISITQPTSDDPAGEMMRRVITMFDEHQSRENSKHTHRSMCENARQGFYNGSSAPFGYVTVTTDRQGARGRMKKRLQVDESESAIVRDIYRWYLHGLSGKTMGVKEIATHLNNTGRLMRGHPWRIQKVHSVLSSRAYLGEHVFNRRDSKSGEMRPPEEWITVHSDPIIDPLTFNQVAAIRSSRAPAKKPPRLVASPHVLTGVLKCACCGSAMTATTGKYGKYKYYKCSRRQSVSNNACQNKKQWPMEQFDDLILDYFCNVVLQPDRLNQLLALLRRKRPAVPRRQVKSEGVMQFGEAVAMNRCCG